MEQDKQQEIIALETALAGLDDTGIKGLGKLLEQFPNITPELLTGAADIVEEEAWSEELVILSERVAQVLTEPFALPVKSLGELRAQSRLTVDDVAEIVELPVETIDYMEEDTPVIGIPPALLRTIGELYGYAAIQVESVLRSQGSNGVSAAAYKLRLGATAPTTGGEIVRQPRLFADILEETGATDEQRRRWLESIDKEPEDIDEDDLFA